MSLEPCEPRHANGKTYTCGQLATPADVASVLGSTLVCPLCIGRLRALAEEHADARGRAALASTYVEGWLSE